MFGHYGLALSVAPARTNLKGILIFPIPKTLHHRHVQLASHYYLALRSIFRSRSSPIMVRRPRIAQEALAMRSLYEGVTQCFPPDKKNRATLHYSR